ncbi:MAG: hypothetical protein BGO26_15210 [Actinobacteria bacterium 69-20]|nr:MarP family serine protease [Actinomycetota bacterium]OJV29688.1 MAG: hypothetical protein BGO26_15210 [Actinobacteria bacterium 69-20]
MNIADVVLVLLLIGAAASGYRRGFVTAIATLLGAVAGALVGVRVAPALANLVSDPTAQLVIGIALLIAGVGVGEMVGQWLGSHLTRHLTWRPVVAVDRGLGLVGYTIGVLIVAWLIAVPLAAAPIPWLSSQIRSSAVLTGVNNVMPKSAERLSGQLRSLFTGSYFPQVLAPLAPAPDTPVGTPDSALAHDPAVLGERASILKIRSDAPQCSQSMEGSGFAVAPGVVVTNAHVVAGSSAVRVETSGAPLPATVVYYDPEVDLAVLKVRGLTAAPLTFAPDPAASGDDAVAAGYPLDGPLTLSPIRIRAQIMLQGPDIYSSATVTRQVYTLRGSVRPGNSGGPLLAADGRVLGVVFGAAIDNPDVGFALTARQVEPGIAAGLRDSAPVSTGRCTSR